MTKQKRPINPGPLYVMLIPGLLLILVFNYIPMAGIVMAFQDFVAAKGLFGRQEWVGFGNFQFAIEIPGTWRAVRNTLVISIQKMILGLVIPIIVAVLLNEVRSRGYKRTIQTIVYLPYFLSWVVLAAMIKDLLSPRFGIVNVMLRNLGGEPITFLLNNTWFRAVLVSTDVWKTFGFGTVIYLAAITNIDPSQYESAVIDGANRWQKIRYITLPGMNAIIVLLATLSLGRVLNAGFEQVLNLYSPLVYKTGDIIDTYVYRLGLIDYKYALGAAVGLFKAVVSLGLISTSYYLAGRFANYRIF